VYGVTSTRIFCRPSCPSRRPRRDRVRFFPGPAEAEAQGYRACKRCRPSARATATATEQAVRMALAFLDRQGERRVSLTELAGEVGISPFHLQRSFRRLVGLSPREYVAARRTDRLRRELRGPGTITRALYEAGFGERAPRLLGMTPGAYRKGGAGMDIRYTMVDSPYGRLLIGATDRGVCSVILGEREAALERDLAAQFPNATRTRVNEGDAWLARLVRQVAGQLKRPAATGAIPLDLHGTAFQYRVWEALMAIPAGETRTYTQLARQVGKPRAVRAVASACAANRVAVVVPCHRVIRSDGSLGGYRWGLLRKAALLRQERAPAH
jgi:AraC family transcriptional regulator of adaptative response/methylated-DNA-[protein]-cysteine methyltransferase